MARKRAINVCSTCHERKIRCDLDTTTSPCSNCREYRSECTPRTRKPYRSTNRNKKNENVNPEEKAPPDTVDISRSVSQLDQTRIVASVVTQPSSRTTSIYVGESGYGAIFDMLRPESPKRRHITINGRADAALNPEDLEYLWLKGCFELPTESNDLLAAYFRFVHPIFPVLDGPSFLRDHASGGLGRLNLLLLWSMFSVSASYVPACSDKETKASFVTRGNVLFELGGENDKLVLVQSALLLSFWFDDAEDIKQSWYWSGIAFSISQTLGLHRTPMPDARQIFRAEYHVWRNAWHCCMLRDTWLSYSMGRPLRLDEAARSTTLPLMAECRFQDVKLQGNSVYSEAEAEGFEKMWRTSVTAANMLRQFLSSRTTEPPVFSNRVKDSLQVQEDICSSLLLSLCYRHLRLCQNAAMIAICQLSGDKEMAETAADGIITTVQSYHDDDTIAYVPPTVVPLIMPAMLISISALKSTELYKRELGERRLSCCLHLLETIERTYPAALIVKQLFLSVYSNIRTQDPSTPT
ncbi:hypothetical protein P152DRAFT_510439 [Eremomyces bilateralis CBS 781.70]|uniref:Zn(2)-C6 fungal-type domain-containing protein n=1 Tax=Eremomyces bilateralis CBS 781.70 TaxID=1392243 RepID=A0A6G1GGB8_9PEZI|nr:uncharacterized protein P152DRAFT_510439 [Eremomyces bilateralis CBS 781.70]KAF1817147.1 hypothetical protein P152DRAFT_510439 [Eremomyces bilateralis CBS 781.70]